MLLLRIQRYLVSRGKEGGSASSIYLWEARICSAELGWRLFSFHSDTYLSLHTITVCKFSSSYPGANDWRWLDKVMGDKKHPYLPGWAPERPKDSWGKHWAKVKKPQAFLTLYPQDQRNYTWVKGRNQAPYYSVRETITRNNFLYSYMKSMLGLTYNLK